MQVRALLASVLGAGGANAYTWSSKEAEIPEFITANAPVVHLYSEERYYPGSPADYVPHFMVSTRDYNSTEQVDLGSLASIGRRLNSSDLFLTSREQWEPAPGPEWLTKFATNQPNLLTGKIENAFATLIVVDKPEINAVDAFWFYFYPFNLGPFVMGHGPFGNHIGDWEHSLVRFNRETHEPEVVWMSAHGGGTAFRFDSMAQENVFGSVRPILFSARGTHAQYTSVGRHSHDIPWHMLSDFTDRGDLWDPAKNFVAYELDIGTGVLRPGNGSVQGREQKFGDWLLFDGHWGNAALDKHDPRQQWSPFEWRMIDGPLGPLAKNLERKVPCERSKWWNYAQSCRIRGRLTAGEGLEAEASGCENLVEVWPRWMQPLVRVIMKDGYVCFWADRLFG